MWKTLDNSCFWITINAKSKEVTIKFLHPLSNIVKEFKFSFSLQNIKLVKEDTIQERILLGQKRTRSIMHELQDQIIKQRDDKIEELTKKLEEQKKKVALLEKESKLI